MIRQHLLTSTSTRLGSEGRQIGKSNNTKNLPQESDEITIPPFPYSEEEEKVVENTHPTGRPKSKKGKGVVQSEVFASYNLQTCLTTTWS